VVALRRALAADAGFLADMLVEAANWHPERVRPKVQLLADPKVNRYLKGWKRPSDDGVLAVDDNGAPIGACWYRVLGPAAGSGAPQSGVAAVSVGASSEPGFGFVAPGVPELTLGVRPLWRAQGVGRALLHALCEVAADRGHQRISLSVERANFAQRLYVSEGFVPVESGTDSDTMVKTLR
jgi:GNAT superfamily N-acetyltransferase